MIIADFFKLQGLEGVDADAVKRFANGWAINDFATIEEFCDKAGEEGLSEIKVTDITRAIMPSARKLYRAWFTGIIGAKLYQLFNRKTTGLAKKNVLNARLQYETLKKRLWKYVIVKAEKMSNE